MTGHVPEPRYQPDATDSGLGVQPPKDTSRPVSSPHGPTERQETSSEGKWFIGHRRPHVLGATSWYGAYRTEDEAKVDKPAVEEYWFRRAGISGPQGYTFIERDDTDDCDYGQMTVERHRKSP